MSVVGIFGAAPIPSGLLSKIILNNCQKAFNYRNMQTQAFKQRKQLRIILRQADYDTI